MKKYNLHLMKLDEVRTICIHTNSCDMCPLKTKEGNCPFALFPNNWELD